MKKLREFDIFNNEKQEKKNVEFFYDPKNCMTYVLYNSDVLTRTVKQ